jgi:hypothetical protein
MDYDTHNITGILCDIAWYNMHNIYIYLYLYSCLLPPPGFACLEKLQETTCSRPIDCDFSWCLLHQTIFIYIYINRNWMYLPGLYYNNSQHIWVMFGLQSTYWPCSSVLVTFPGTSPESCLHRTHSAKKKASESLWTWSLELDIYSNMMEINPAINNT